MLRAIRTVRPFMTVYIKKLYFNIWCIYKALGFDIYSYCSNSETILRHISLICDFSLIVFQILVILKLPQP